MPKKKKKGLFGGLFDPIKPREAGRSGNKNTDRLAGQVEGQRRSKAPKKKKPSKKK